MIKYFVQGHNTVVLMGFKMQGFNPTIIEQDTLSTVIHKIISNNYSKPVLSSLSKIDKTTILMIIGNLMQLKSIAECSKGRGAFCNTFELH